MDKRAERFITAWENVNTVGKLDYDEVITDLCHLESCYREEGRYYHDLNHIDDCLDKAYDYGLVGAGVLALFYHDAVYVPGSKTNEEDSARLFREVADRFATPTYVIAEIDAIILATKHIDPPKNALAAVVVDIDMSGLGADYETFTRNTANIRKEYGMFTDEQWKAGRTHFLESLLAKPRIYWSYHFHDLLEEKARANIRRSLEELKNA